MRPSGDAFETRCPGMAKCNGRSHAKRIVRDSLEGACVAHCVHAIHHAADLILGRGHLVSDGAQQILVCGVVPRHALISHFEGIGTSDGLAAMQICGGSSRRARRLTGWGLDWWWRLKRNES